MQKYKKDTNDRWPYDCLTEEILRPTYILSTIKLNEVKYAYLEYSKECLSVCSSSVDSLEISRS